MTDGVLSSKEFAGAIITLQKPTPLVADERELSCLVRLPLRKQFTVAVLVNAGEAETVQGALDSMAEREEAHTRALARRSRFGVVRDP
jgi:hypothetical protein